MEKQTEKPKNLDVSKLTPEEKQTLKDSLKADEQKTNWSGKFGIRTAFRNIGKAYIYKPNKEISVTDKKQQLKNDIEKFLAERL